MPIAKLIASPRLIAISAVKPELLKAKPPLRPSAINRYKDRKREMGGGISRLDLTKPAKMPKMKKRMVGSSKIFMGCPLKRS